MPTNSQQRVQWQWDQQEWVLQQQWAQQQWEQQQQWGAAQQQPGLCMYNLVQEQEQWWPQQQCAPPQQWAPPPQPGPIPGRVNNHQQMHDLQQTMCNMAIAAQSHMGSATSREHRRGLVMMSGCEVGREPTAPAAATWERQATLAALISKPATDKGTTANAEPPKLISDGRRRRQELLQDEYKAVRPDDACRRCGMTQEQHTPLRGTLQKHHLVPINQGGHPSDPANLYTLCHFCHSEWHSFWEHCFRGQCSTSKTWKVYMAATPYCKTVRTAGDRHDIQTVQVYLHSSLDPPASASAIVNTHGLAPLPPTRGPLPARRCHSPSHLRTSGDGDGDPLPHSSPPMAARDVAYRLRAAKCSAPVARPSTGSSACTGSRTMRRRCAAPSQR